MTRLFDSAMKRAVQWFTHKLDVAEGVEAKENAKRIDRIPADVLAHNDPARDALVALALYGHDVDAYIPAASKEWRIWCRPAHPSMQGRYTIEEWRAVYASEFARIVAAKEGQAPA